MIRHSVSVVSSCAMYCANARLFYLFFVVNQYNWESVCINNS